MKKLFLATALLILSSQTIAYCQGDSTVLKNAVFKLKTVLSNHFTEKAYLHFDKPFYAAGDTIYFKAYVIAGELHQLSALSGVLHVDLINGNSKTDQSIKLQLNKGIAWGDFALPDSLPSGNYHVRAYTRWMKNDPDSFFDKVIPIGSISGKAIVYESASGAKILAQKKPDLQFFPEGGYLVQGIRSKIAFKAIAADGKGIAVKGVVNDNNNNEVNRFESVRLGMGSFYLLPEGGKTYKATLTFADGTQNTIDLPAAEDKGMVLAVDNQSANIFYAGIFANKKYFEENKGQTLGLVIYSGGSTKTVITKLDNPRLILRLPKSEFKTGVAQITLFSAKGEPLNERLAFIQNPGLLTLTLKSDKLSYKTREKVTLSLNLTGKDDKPATGHFSISVIDEGKVPADENNETTILNYLLLTSDLKGFIEEPNYYFTDVTDKTRADLDLVMLTHGYRRFEWKQVLENNYPAMAYQPEKGLEINGMVKNLFGKPIGNGTITLLAFKGGPLLSSVSDDKGMFHFSNLVFNDTTHFVLSAVNKNGRNSTKLTYFTDKPEPVAKQLQVMNIVADTAMALLLNNDKVYQDELVKYGHIKGIMLKEVKIRDKKIDDQYKTQSLAGAGNADQVMHADEIERIQGPLSTSLNGRLYGVNFIRHPSGDYAPVLGPAGSAMYVIIDGTEDADINSLSANDVETVEVLKYAGSTAIYGMRGAAGVLIITTKQGGGLAAKDIASIGILPITPMGFYKAREFYSPKYDNTELASKQRDLRSTIYWKPELVTDKDGNASFEYYNADGTGTYKVVIEGIDSNGNLGRQVYRYKVE